MVRLYQTIIILMQAWQWFWVVFLFIVVYLIYFRLIAPFMDYKRLQAQGVVFNSKGYPLIYDVIGLNEMAVKHPYCMQAGNCIKLTNDLERFPPMHGIFLP